MMNGRFTAFDHYSEIPLYRLACCRRSVRFGESFFKNDSASGARAIERRDNLEENAAAGVSKEGIDASPKPLRPPTVPPRLADVGALFARKSPLIVQMDTNAISQIGHRFDVNDRHGGIADTRLSLVGAARIVVNLPAKRCIHSSGRPAL